MLHLILKLNATKILIKKSLNSELVTMSGYRNTKKSLLKNIPTIGQKKFLSLAKLKIQFCGHT